MNRECEQSTPKKWRKSPGWKNEKNMIKPKNEQREAATDKENRGVAAHKQRQRKKETLKNVSNLLPAPPSSFSKETGHVSSHKGAAISRSLRQSHGKALASSPSCPIKSNSSLEEELQAVRLRLQKLNIDKKRTGKLLDDRDALLKQQEAELEIKAKAQEMLQLQLRKLQKLKDFKAALSYPLEQSLRMMELAKEQEKDKNINDPNKLEEPALPYILWCQDQWNQMKSETENISFKDMRTIMGEKWKVLNDKYEGEKEACLQMKSETENISFKDMGTIMGEKWKVLNAEEKKRYNDKYEGEKEACLQMKSETENISFKDMRTIMGEKWKVLNDKYEGEKEACLQQQNEEGTLTQTDQRSPQHHFYFPATEQGKC